MSKFADGESPLAPRVLVVQPDPADPLERWEGWLREGGVDITVVRPFAGEPVPHCLEETGLIVLGGEMSVRDSEAHPWLQDVRVLLRDAVDRGAPTLGICLGGQLLADALGGMVSVGSGVEAGVARVRVRPDASDDLLLGGLGEFPVGSMHGDMIETLPADGHWLASSSDYPHQAFRIGKCAWGVQFHPEISPATYREWAQAYSASTDTGDLLKVKVGMEEFDAADEEVVMAARALASRFADLLTSSACAT